MKLTKNFTLEEFEHSETAIRNNIDNRVPERYIKNVKALAEKVLQPTRNRIGIPIYISSGYRCKMLNTAVKGAVTSQHTRGEAADIFIDPVCSLGWTLWDVCKLIVKHTDLDQLIWETRPNGSKWIHVSFVTYRKNRHNKLRTNDGIHYEILTDPL